jgi:predicted PurR-regulated permease PerM
MCLGVSRQLEEITLTDQQVPEAAPETAGPLMDAPVLLVPRWIQLIVLPIILLFGWIFAEAVRHALFVFVVSGIIAMLLNPLVSTLTSLRLPRGLAVLVVYLSLATVIVGAIGLAGVAAVNQVTSASATISQEFDKQPGQRKSSAERRVDRFQTWLDDRGLSRVHVKDIGNRLVQNIQKKGVGDYAKRAVDIGQQVASQVVQGLIELLLVLVISIYLLLDAPRIARGLDRVFPPGPDGIRLGPQVQKGLIRYVRGQATVSLLIGASSGIGVEILSLTGVWPEGSQYALILGLWAMATEVIPYVGPILGAIPALVLAALHTPATAIWVGLFYLAVHQLEGHVVVPRVMGQALGAHPLLVIFALVAGAELFGIAGALLALPVLAMGREVAIFLRRRIRLEPWPTSTGFAGGGLDVTVPVRIEPEPPTPT